MIVEMLSNCIGNICSPFGLCKHQSDDRLQVWLISFPVKITKLSQFQTPQLLVAHLLSINNYNADCRDAINSCDITECKQSTKN